MRILFFQDENELLKRLCLSRPFGSDFLSALAQKASLESESANLLIGKQWVEDNPQLNGLDTFTYEKASWTLPDSVIRSKSDEICLLNGSAVFSVDEQQLKHTLGSFSWDVVTIRVSPDLQASKEILKLTSDANVVGFRRFYAPSIEPAHAPSQWPDIVIFKRPIWDKVCEDGRFPLDFDQLRNRIGPRSYQVTHLRAGGQRRPLDKESAFLDCLQEYWPEAPESGDGVNQGTGMILIGDNVTVEPNVTLVGPIVLSSNVHVKSGAVVRRSILAENTVVQSDQVVNNRILFEETDAGQSNGSVSFVTMEDCRSSFKKEYKNWSMFSYARLGKRIFDLIASSLVLILLIPIFAVVAIVVKLSSPGPLFYRARRQGLHGKDFNCLKFRSMMVAADSMQERLRAVNQVDGPQFKMENDPRITGVGKFLRDTYIDELPQFINVLIGQMSIVGPRPSPENENESSPAWRDARLSVRPGITGLWQVLRTRQEGADFQEWVYYDTRYVRNLSFRTDLWICWKTAQKLIHSFLGQFG